MEYINNNLDQELSLEQLASVANMSMYHFARIFRNTIGSSPHRYIVEARMGKAKFLLSRTDKSISEIALDLGYSINHFGQVFRRCLGCSPSKYREENRIPKSYSIDP